MDLVIIYMLYRPLKKITHNNNNNNNNNNSSGIRLTFESSSVPEQRYSSSDTSVRQISNSLLAHQSVKEPFSSVIRQFSNFFHQFSNLDLKAVRTVTEKRRKYPELHIDSLQLKITVSRFCLD